MRDSRSLVLRGAVAGLIGGAALALWFHAVDVIRGVPLQTPAFLAGALAGHATPVGGVVPLVLITLLHFALFLTVGVLVVWALARAAVPTHFLLGPLFGLLLFDIVFYAGVVLTGVHVVRALGWPAVLMGNVLAGTAMFVYLHRTAPEPVPAWLDFVTGNRVVREGVLTGLLGAAVVAVWFLVLDLAGGRAFFTPAALGSALLHGAQDARAVQVTAGVVAAYTLVHCVAFIAVGLIAAAVVATAQRHPPVLLGAALLFVTLEVFALGLIALAATWLLHTVPWWSIAIANVLAAASMGLYLWRGHPEMQRALQRQDLEEPGYEVVRG